MKLRKRLGCLLLVLTMLLALFPVTVQAAGFRDIQGHWAEADINEAVEQGLFTGTSATTFSPNASMTRAMFVTVLYRMDDGAAIGDAYFIDIDTNAWYYDAVCWANENGLVTGTDTWHFSPNQNITREQMVTILYRYLNYMEAGLEHTTDVPIRFLDQSKISAYAKDAVTEMQLAGIIGGKPAGTGYRFDPQGNATRAEAARVFCLFLDRMYWGEEELPSELTESMNYAQEEFEIVELDYQDDDGYIREADLPKVLADLESLAKEWLEEGFITRYEVNEDNIVVKLEAGASYMHIPSVYEYREYAGSLPRQIQFYEPYYTEDRNTVSYFYDAQQKYGTGENLCKKVAAAESSYTYGGRFADNQTNLESVKAWGPDSIIVWLGHGGYSESMGPVLFTGEFQGKNEPQAVFEDLDKDRLVVSDGNRFGVTAAYFDKYYSENSLSGSLIWLGACKSAKDTRLGDVLIKKGACAVVGSTESIGIPFLVNQTNYFFTRLTEKDGSGNRYTAEEALSYAKIHALANSPPNILFGQMYLFSNGPFCLSGTTTQIMGFVQDNVTHTPIAGAKVSLSDTSLGGTTNAEGKYTISGMDAGKTYTIKAEAEDYLTASRSVTTSGSGSVGVNFALDPVPRISIELSPDSGTVAKGTVTVYKEDGTTKVGTHTFTTAAFEIGGLESANYKLEISADGYQTTIVTAKAASDPVTQIVKLTQLEGKISLRLVPNSGTVTGGKVATTKTAGLTSSTSETSDFTGSSFVIGALEPGAQYKVDIAAEGYNAATVTVNAAVNPTVTTVNLTAKVSLPILGKTATVTVKDFDTGAALSGAAVTLYGGPSSSSLIQLTTGTTNSSGVFTAAVPMHSVYKAEATLNGYVRGSTETSSTTIGVTLSKEPDLTPDPEPDPGIPAGYTPIYTAEEFAALKGDEKVILMKNISFTDAVRGSKYIWSGVLDGNGHTISGVKVDGYTEAAGWINTNSGTIKNVRFQISMQGVSTGPSAVIGMNTSSGTIENCVVTGSISASRTSSNGGWVGAAGLVGNNGGVIRNCVNRASVSATATGPAGTSTVTAKAGGIAVLNTGEITNCLNLGYISVSSKNFARAGGIAADQAYTSSGYKTGTVSGCGNGGTVSIVFTNQTGGVTGGFRHPVYAYAEDGYATSLKVNYFGDNSSSYESTKLELVTLEELYDMWADYL